MIVNSTRVNFFNLFSRIIEPIMNTEMSIYKEFKVTALLKNNRIDKIHNKLIKIILILDSR